MFVSNTRVIEAHLVQLKSDVADLQDLCPKTPLDNFLSQLEKCLKSYALKHDDHDSTLFLQAALEMLHHYFECLKSGNLKKADETLHAFVKANPVSNENLRCMLIWGVASILALAVIFFPIAVMIWVVPTSSLLVLFPLLVACALALAAGVAIVALATVMTNEVPTRDSDTDKHIAAQDIEKISSPVGSFFKEFVPSDKDPSSCCFTNESENEISYVA